MKRYQFSLMACLLLTACSGTETQEECAADAARDASTNEALRVLLSDCARRFPATQQSDGSFSMHVPELGRSVTVSGPSPTSEDRAEISRLIVAERQNQETARRAKEERRLEAQENLSIRNASIECNNWIAGHCYGYSGIFSVKNNSNVKINKVFFGYAIGARVDCQGWQNFGREIPIPVWPGQTVSHSFELPTVSDKSGRGCASLSVSEVE